MLNQMTTGAYPSDGRDVLTTLAKLPRICAARMPGTNEATLIKRGVMGYWPARNPRFDVDGFNARMGVTPAQREAMQAGSMFGWDCPAADPDSYDEAGNPLKVAS